MRHYVFTGILLLGLAIALPGQVILRTHHDSAAPQPGNVKVTVINPNGKKQMRYEGNSLHTDSVQQALKLSLFQFARGEFSAYYEYRLADAFSVEAGAGVTYIDYIYELFNNEGRFLGKTGEGRNVRFLSGFAAHAQFRWYPSRYETAITGFYLAPDITRRDWRMEYYVNTGLIREPHPVKRTWTECRLQLGYQDADPYENIFWEWYLTAGMRLVDQDVINGAGLDASFEHQKFWEPTISGGIKLGFTL